VILGKMRHDITVGDDALSTDPKEGHRGCWKTIREHIILALIVTIIGGIIATVIGGAILNYYSHNFPNLRGMWSGKYSDERPPQTQCFYLQIITQGEPDIFRRAGHIDAYAWSATCDTHYEGEKYHISGTFDGTNLDVKNTENLDNCDIHFTYDNSSGGSLRAGHLQINNQ
jgi:hypothetical protein